MIKGSNGGQNMAMSSASQSVGWQCKDTTELKITGKQFKRRTLVSFHMSDILFFGGLSQLAANFRSQQVFSKCLSFEESNVNQWEFPRVGIVF